MSEAMRDFEKEYWEAQTHINELETENSALRRLAADYIAAFEKLAFDDTTQEKETKP